jgi:putative thioredoxin
MWDLLFILLTIVLFALAAITGRRRCNLRATALNASGEREQAADALLDIIRRNRGWNDDAARLQLLKFFEAWGFDDPATAAARRRLSSVLFS